MHQLCRVQRKQNHVCVKINISVATYTGILEAYELLAITADYNIIIGNNSENVATQSRD